MSSPYDNEFCSDQIRKQLFEEMDETEFEGTVEEYYFQKKYENVLDCEEEQDE